MSSFLTFTSAYFFFFLPLRLIGWNSKSFPPEPLAMFFFSNESPIFSVNVTIGMQANHWVGWNIWLNLTSVCSHHRRSCFGQTGATSFMLQPPSKEAGGHTSNYLSLPMGQSHSHSVHQTQICQGRGDPRGGDHWYGHRWCFTSTLRASTLGGHHGSYLADLLPTDLGLGSSLCWCTKVREGSGMEDVIWKGWDHLIYI